MQIGTSLFICMYLAEFCDNLCDMLFNQEPTMTLMSKIIVQKVFVAVNLLFSQNRIERLFTSKNKCCFFIW